MRAWIGPCQGRPPVEERVHDAGSSRMREKMRAEADEPSRRDGELQAHPPRAGVIHLHHLPASHGEKLRHHADVLFGDVDDEQLDRLVHVAVDLPGHHGRLRHRELVAFAAHGLDQDAELELPAPGDPNRVRRIGVLDADAHVAAPLQLEALAELARGHVVALAAGPRGSCSRKRASRSSARRCGSVEALSAARGRRWYRRCGRPRCRRSPRRHPPYRAPLRRASAPAMRRSE